MNAPLYNERILRLTMAVPDRRLDAPAGTSEKRSPVCGSRVMVEVVMDTDGRVADVGMVVRACALGQAASALLAQGIVGRTPGELADARDALAGWLAGTAGVPAWPGIDVFTPALSHHARHASIRLAFEAAADAAADARDAR